MTKKKSATMWTHYKKISMKHKFHHSDVFVWRCLFLLCYVRPWITELIFLDNDYLSITRPNACEYVQIGWFDFSVCKCACGRIAWLTTSQLNVSNKGNRLKTNRRSCIHQEKSHIKASFFVTRIAYRKSQVHVFHPHYVSTYFLRLLLS